VVQEPEEAIAPSMPLSALQHLQVDYRCLLDALALLLAQMVNDPPGDEPSAMLLFLNRL